LLWPYRDTGGLAALRLNYISLIGLGVRRKKELIFWVAKAAVVVVDSFTDILVARRKIRLIEYNPKCRHIKNILVKGLCSMCLSV
jgi:hypothetical protein